MKFTKNQKVILIVALIAVVLFRILANYTTLLVNVNQDVPEGYLPLKDYVLVDGNTGIQSASIRSLNYGDHYTFYDSNNGLETTKGISCDSSWEDLLEAYGDYKASSISATLPYNSAEYNSPQNVYEDDMTLNEFNEKYIQTNQISLDTHNIHVYYSASARLTKVYYTQEEQYNLYDKNHAFWNFKEHSFQLSISYSCEDDDFNDTDQGIIDYISSDCWSY